MVKPAGWPLIWIISGKSHGDFLMIKSIGEFMKNINGHENMKLLCQSLQNVDIAHFFFILCQSMEA